MKRQRTRPAVRALMGGSGGLRPSSRVLWLQHGTVRCVGRGHWMVRLAQGTTVVTHSASVGRP